VREHRLQEGNPVPSALDRHIRSTCERAAADYLLR